MKSGAMSKRAFLRVAAGAGGLAGLGGLLAPGQTLAQLLESGIEGTSVLAGVTREGTLRIGFAQTLPWFYRDAKASSLAGIYYDLCEALAAELEVKAEYFEVSWANATVALRKGDFDIFGSSLFYTVPRALVVSYTAPLWHKGHLALTHKDNAKRFKSPADFNRPDVTFSVNAGTREEQLLTVLFPKAKIVTAAGEIALSAEPVRTKRADLWVSGDLDVLAFAKRHSAWAHVVAPDKPFGRGVNTWAIRYGDPAWKFFLDAWVSNTVASGFVEERYQHYKEQLARS